MKERIKKIIGYVVGLVLILYLFCISDFEWNKLALLSFEDFFLFSILSIVLLFLNGISLYPQLALFGLYVSKIEVFMISQFYNLLNYLPLKAGLIGEGVQLKLSYGLSYKRFIGANIISYIINFSLYAITAFFFFIFYDFSVIFPFAKTSYFIIFLLIIIGFVFIYLLLPKRFSSIKGLSLFFEDREIIWKSKKQIIILFFLSLVGFFITAIRLFLLFHILGYDISVPAVFVMSVLASLAFLFSITPGGIGIRETFMGTLSFFVFQDIGIGVVVSMIVRIFDFVWTVVFGTYAFHFLSKNNFFQKNGENKENSA